MRAMAMLAMLSSSTLALPTAFLKTENALVPSADNEVRQQRRALAPFLLWPAVLHIALLPCAFAHGP